MYSKSRLTFVLSLTVALAMVLAYFALPGTAMAQGKTLNVAFSQEPNTLNPYYTQSAFATWATYLIGAHFFDYDEKQKISLKMAAELPTVENGGLSKDGKTYTLKLKPNLKWSDGKPLTADDLAFTLQMINDKANAISQFTLIQGEMEEVKVVNPTTVSVKLKNPQPFPENVVGPGFIVLPKHIYNPIYEKDKTLDNTVEPLPTVFSGPFLLKEWKKGESMTFDANPDYVLGKPKIDHLVIKFFEAPEASYAALAAGQIDWLPNLQPADGKQIQDLTKDVTFFSLYGSYREFLVFNVTAKGDAVRQAGPAALRDVNVRRAIRLGIDREKLVKDGLFGLASVADSLYDQTAYLNKNIKFTKYNLAAAEKLLDDAGWKKGSDGIRAKTVEGKTERMEFSYLTTTAAQRKSNQAILQQDLAKLGIKVNLDNKPASEYFAPATQGGILATGKFDFGEFANNTVTTNPANASVRAFLMCAEVVSEKNPAGNNNGGYCNEALGIDKLQLTTEQSLDAKASQAAADKIQEIFDQEVPLIILYNRDDIYAYKTSRFASAPRIGTGIQNMWFDVHNWVLK